MSILDILFRNKPWLTRKTITDDTFGLMWFKKQQDSEFDHYQGHFTFKPTNSEIDIFIDSDKDDIESRQKAFFREIETRYSDCIAKSVRPTEEFLQKKNKQNLQISNFENEFKLFAISIPREPSQKWSLSFSSEKHSLYGMTINFKNWEIAGITE